MREAELIADRYRLESRIAVGGMGEVWKAVDTRIGRFVAVKLLHRDMSGNRIFRHRFATEARLVASLNTPRIATLHDYGEFETSVGMRSYLVMELIKGRALTAVLKEHQTLSDSETMRIIAEVAEGLHVAHTAGIVHRDIKPANILITTDGDVKLVDFGIARAAGEADVTETNTVVGTLAYTSPEHINKTEPSPATDIYSLGIVAYQCLAGRTPFQSDKPHAVMFGHLNDPPPALPSRVPEAIVHTIMTALNKEPGDRWSSAAVFAAKCRENIDAETTETRPTPGDEAAGAAGATGSAVTPQPFPFADDADRYRDATIPPDWTDLTPQQGTLPGDAVRAESPPPPPPGRRPRRTVLVKVAALVVVALLLGAVSLWWGLSPDGDTPATDKAGQSATSAAASQKSSAPADKSSSNSPDEKSQSPNSPNGDDNDNDAGGEDDGCGDNCGTVPNVRNKSCDEAVGILAEKGFSKTEKQFGNDPTGEVDYGAVYSQSPKAESVVSKSSTIKLYFRNAVYCSNA